VAEFSKGRGIMAAGAAAPEGVGPSAQRAKLCTWLYTRNTLAQPPSASSAPAATPSLSRRDQRQKAFGVDMWPP
jgi:hypothetical protein